MRGGFWHRLREFELGRGLRRGRGRRLAVAGGHDDAPDWLNPLAVVGDASAGMDGAEDDVWVGFGLIGMFDEEFGGEAEILAAKLVETQGMSVAIHGAVIRDLVIRTNQVGVAPIDEVFFDASTVGVVADVAFAGVAFEVGEAERFVAVRARGIIGVAIQGFGDELGGVSAGDEFEETPRLRPALGPGFVFAVALGWKRGDDLGERVGGGSFFGRG